MKSLWTLLLALLSWLSDDPGRLIAGVPRSSEWSKFREYRIEECGCCEACGCKQKLEVHHIQPYHERPDLELVKENTVVLCRECHWFFGHLKCWASWNSEIIRDIMRYRSQVESRP